MICWSRKEIQLFGAFLLTTLGDRMWAFVIGFFMHHFGGMTWVAVQQLVDSALKLIGITIAGQFLDRIDRDKIIQRTLLLNNTAVFVSALIYFGMFAIETKGYTTIFLFLASAFGSVSKVASELQRISFQKDWVIVIAKTEQIDLSKLNRDLLVLDQLSTFVLPLAFGIALQLFPWSWICLFIAGYNCVSWAAESHILHRLYEETEQLRTRASELTGDEELRGLKDVKLNSFTTYFKQSSWMAGFGLALLYMTVLGFDNLAASYGQKHGLSAGYIGLARAVGALIGIFGSSLYHLSAKQFGLLWTVMIGLIWQNIFINLCGVSVLLPGSSMDVFGFYQNTTVDQWWNQMIEKVTKPETQEIPTVPLSQVALPIILFFTGISFARFGLWLADPAISQIQQETIPERQRYSVFTVQLAICEFFSILKDIIVILLPFTSLFGLLTLGSCAFVFCGFLLNVFYHYKCGFSFSDKNRHLRYKNAIEMSAISSALPEAETLLTENGKIVHKEENGDHMESNGTTTLTNGKTSKNE